MKTHPFFAVREMSLELGDPMLLEGVAEVNDHLNTLGRQHFRDVAEGAQTDPETGIQYAIVGTKALTAGRGVAFMTMDAPFANGVWPHIVARAESLAEMAYRGGMRDEDGAPVPVLVRGAPSARSRFGLWGDDLQTVAGGDPTPIAAAQNELASRLGFGELFGDVSFSQPSAHVASRMRDAQQHFDIFGGVLIGDPPHGERLGIGRFGLRFMREGIRFGKSVKQSGIDVITEDGIIESPNFYSGAIKERDENLAIIRGFGKAGLEEDLKDLRSSNVPSTLLHAGKSLITGRQVAIEAVDNANADVDAFGLHEVRRIEVVDADHSLADLVGHFGTIAAGVITTNHLRKSYERGLDR